MASKLAAPAVVTVGDELVYGERSNDNQSWMLSELYARGVPARLALSLPDDELLIGRELRKLLDDALAPVFVSGGIGGTHDDRTRQGVAQALGVPIERHAQCDGLLADKYGERYTAQRRRMAELPRGCSLIPNELGAPGFHAGGIFAFPGFPNMLKPMFGWVLRGPLADLGAPPMSQAEFVLEVSEGDVALALERFAGDHPDARIGIYPSTERYAREVTVRLRHPAGDPAIGVAFAELIEKLRDELSA